MLNLKKLIFSAFFFLLFVMQSCQVTENQLKTGDLIYQNLNCGDLCDAIEKVTAGKEDYHFSHIGLVSKEGKGVYIYESIGSGVQKTPLDTFLARTSEDYYVSRLEQEYAYMIPSAIEYVNQHLGDPYDDEFLYDNGKYYCSELILDAFTGVVSDGHPFDLHPMEFYSPTDSSVGKIWEAYYAELGIPVPQGLPGANPASIARSLDNKWLRKLKLKR